MEPTATDTDVDSLLRAVAATPSIPPLDTLRGQFAGRYSLERLLGEGGMGSVYLAREVQLDRVVALKIIRADVAADAGFRDRLLAEAKTAAKMRHPNIVPVFRVDEIDGVLAMAMGYVEGSSLRDILRSRGALSSTRALRMVRDAAWGLAHAHAAGIVHRDIKPDNLLVDASADHVVIADFGIAAASGARDVSGTRAYMSPEQARGDPADAKSDVYSLGVTAWELCTGARPAPGAQLEGVPSNVAALIEHMLRDDPSARPTAADVADELTRVLDGRRVPASLRHWAGTDATNIPGALIVAALIPSALGQPVAQVAATTALIFIVLGARRIGRARALMRAGHTQDELLQALEARREELTGVDTTPLPPRERRSWRVAAAVALVLLAVTALGIVALTLFGSDDASSAPVDPPHELAYKIGFGLVIFFVIFASVVLFGVVALAITASATLTPTIPWETRGVLAARTAFWRSAFATRLLRNSAGKRAAPIPGPIERALAIEATDLVVRRGKSDDAVSLIRALEANAADARARADETELQSAVALLERLRIAGLRDKPDDVEATLTAARSLLGRRRP